MPVDPAVASLLQMLAASGTPEMHEMPPEQGRAAFRTLMVDLRPAASVVAVGAVEDTTVADAVPVRVYRPAGTGTHPTIVYLHGGGFVIGDLDTHDGVCRRLCRDIDAVVVSVDYPLAPEHPFPAALDACWAAVQWVADHVADFGGDGDRLVVGGDSAGGNLAAVCAQQAHAAGRSLAAQLLLYPATDFAGDFASRTENGTGYFLTEGDVEWFAEQYTGLAGGSAALADPAVAAFAADPRLSPLRATSLAGLPPAVIATAEFDPLRDEGNAYAAALRDAGVEVRHQQFAGLIHGFYGLEYVSPAIEAATTWIDTALKELLS